MLEIASLVLATLISAVVQYVVFNCLDCLQEKIPNHSHQKNKKNGSKKKRHTAHFG